MQGVSYKTPAIVRAMVFVVPLLIINSICQYIGVHILFELCLSMLAIMVLWVLRHRTFRSLDKLNIKAEQDYNVRFDIFIALYVVSFLPFYFGAFLVVKGTVSKSLAVMIIGLMINRLAWAMPYLYPYFFGTLPRKLKIAMLIWLASGVAYGIAKVATN